MNNTEILYKIELEKIHRLDTINWTVANPEDMTPVNPEDLESITEEQVAKLAISPDELEPYGRS